jgi:adenosylmethionine-8-amino-7-oxononanoate aminotransferase
MSYLINKDLNNRPIKLRGGKGVWLHDEMGNNILDTCGGVAVSSLGHCHPGVTAALSQQTEMLSWAHAGSFTSDAAEQLGEFLVLRSGGMGKIQFLSGGSEAMEVAMKVAYQFHCENGQPKRQCFISRHQSYHGSTFGALALSGNPGRRSIFSPLLSFNNQFVSACNAYRGKLDHETNANYAVRLAAELEDKIITLGPENVAAFVFEPIVGSTCGAVPAVKGYMQLMKNVCARHGVLLILDDVMSGMGRTGSLYAHLDHDILPDIVAIGKGLAAGYQPISAYLISQHIHDVISQGSGVLGNGQTHVNHPYACQVALAVQKIIEHDQLLDNVKQRGEQMRQGFTKLLADVEYVGDIRGEGLFIGIEFVADKLTKKPLAGGAECVRALKQEGLRRNMLLYPGNGTADGSQGNHLLFAPPFIASSEEVEEMVGRTVELILQMSGDFKSWCH